MIIFSKTIKFSIGLILMLCSLAAYSQSSDSLRYMRNFEKKLTNNVINNYVDYHSLSLKMDVKIETKNNTYKLNILYRAIKDSVIWINVNHNTGISLARILITPDTVKMLNRRENEYVEFSTNEVVKKFNYDIDFHMLQSVITAQLINLDPNKKVLKTYKKYRVYLIEDSLYLMQNFKKKKVERLIKKDKIDEYYIHEVLIDKTYKIRSTSIKSNISKQKIIVDYTKYDSKIFFVEKINFLLQNKEKQSKIEINIKKVKIDPASLKFQFKIPKKYKFVDLSFIKSVSHFNYFYKS